MTRLALRELPGRVLAAFFRLEVGVFEEGGVRKQVTRAGDAERSSNGAVVRLAVPVLQVSFASLSSSFCFWRCVDNETFVFGMVRLYRTKSPAFHSVSN